MKPFHNYIGYFAIHPKIPINKEAFFTTYPYTCLSKIHIMPMQHPTINETIDELMKDSDLNEINTIRIRAQFYILLTALEAKDQIITELREKLDYLQNK